MIFCFLWLCLKLIFHKLFNRNFQSMLHMSLLPGSHYKKVRTAKLYCHWLRSLWRQANIFRCNPSSRKRQLYCKHRRIGEVKTNVYIFFYKIFTNILFKSYTATAMWCRVLAKWDHFKMTSLFLFLTFLVINATRKATGFKSLRL